MCHKQRNKPQRVDSSPLLLWYYSNSWVLTSLDKKSLIWERQHNPYRLVLRQNSMSRTSTQIQSVYPTTLSKKLTMRYPIATVYHPWGEPPWQPWTQVDSKAESPSEELASHCCCLAHFHFHHLPSAGHFLATFPPLHTRMSTTS